MRIERTVEDEWLMEDVRALVEAPALRARTADPDAALVAAAREQPQAFLALYDRYFDRVLGYARLRIRDESTCEDIASTVFTTALEQIRRFRGDGTFAGWLFQIARNTVRDVHRKPAVVPLPAEGTVSEQDLEQRLLAHERVGHLRTLIRLLKPEHQHLLALRYGAGLAFDEIGEIVGASPGTVRVRMHRILEELRRRYSDDI
jgi:RNA polymerase sigma-70 factor (ECF subfamily)